MVTYRHRIRTSRYRYIANQGVLVRTVGGTVGGEQGTVTVSNIARTVTGVRW